LESIINFLVSIRLHLLSQRWSSHSILQLLNFATFSLSQPVVVSPFAGGFHLQPCAKVLQRFTTFAALRSISPVAGGIL
jgi:hypothetical protein